MGDREGDRGLEICVCMYPLSEREREREQKWKVSSVAKRDLRRLMQVADIQRLLINGLLIIQTISSRLIPWLWLAFFIFFFLVFFSSFNRFVHAIRFHRYVPGPGLGVTSDYYYYYYFFLLLLLYIFELQSSPERREPSWRASTSIWDVSEVGELETTRERSAWGTRTRPGRGTLRGSPLWNDKRVPTRLTRRGLRPRNSVIITQRFKVTKCIESIT